MVLLRFPLDASQKLIQTDFVVHHSENRSNGMKVHVYVLIPFLSSSSRSSSNENCSKCKKSVSLNPAWRGAERLSFVFDFVPCETAIFDDLHFLFDAARAPLQKLDEATFELTYGLPRCLIFAPHRPREPLESDLLSTVYS